MDALVCLSDVQRAFVQFSSVLEVNSCLRCPDLISDNSIALFSQSARFRRSSLQSLLTAFRPFPGSCPSGTHPKPSSGALSGTESTQ
jgi:hypothetical protein